jgi:hypothetical protein
MVEGEGKPSYVPRMVVMMAESGHYSRAGKEGGRAGTSEYGRGFHTSTGSMKHRRYQTAAETEEAMKKRFGDEATIARDIASLPLATAKLRKAIAARVLLNKLKSIGNEYGANLTSEGKQPGFFTMDHPAFYTWRPQLQKNAAGKWEQAKFEDGTPAWEKTPIYIHNDFEGPLKAVLGKDTGRLYQALMTIRSKAMVMVMYSPVIHNMVEFSRALPVMPRQVVGGGSFPRPGDRPPGWTLAGKVYFLGNAWKHDVATMKEAIGTGGMVPIGKRFVLGQEMSSIMEEQLAKPGRSWTSAVASLPFDLFDPARPGQTVGGSGDKVREWVDKAGDVWHNTLLWDRVGDLQMGLYMLTRDGLLAKGYSRSTSVRAAGHIANRYAGALPLESMSTWARMLANIVLFSRTFTLGNIGVIKDIFTGAPRDVMSQIERDVGKTEADRIRWFLRRKALATVGLDIALGIISTAILASTIKVLLLNGNWNDEMKGYLRRFDNMMKRTKEDPFQILMHPINTLWSLTPSGGYEPRKRNQPYIQIGFDRKTGEYIYMRNPFGKMGEDFAGWVSDPIRTFERKEGMFARPTHQALENNRYVGSDLTKSPIFDPRPNSNSFKNVARFMALYLEGALPAEPIKAAGGLGGVGPYAKSGVPVNIGKIVGPLIGTSVSRGVAGGKTKAEQYEKRDEKRLHKMFD